MPLRRFRRQYEQLLQLERGRIIGMMEAGWSARLVARQLGRSDCVVRRCWDQWIREMSFTRRQGRLRQTSHREDIRIVEPSLGFPVSSRTIRRRLAEGHLGSRHPIRVLPLTPTHRPPPFGVVPRTRKLDCSGIELGRLFSYESRFNVSSDDNCVRVWKPCGERLNPAFALQRHTTPTAGVMVWGPLPTIHGNS
ncbi:transposable element Tcb2 transposase [Trichonephila clavipes]|nr:transposable element Tcb2 transposase [Trichonephila clavipes]